MKEKEGVNTHTHTQERRHLLFSAQRERDGEQFTQSFIKQRERERRRKKVDISTKNEKERIGGREISFFSLYIRLK
jgi:hypothetical protein